MSPSRGGSGWSEKTSFPSVRHGGGGALPSRGPWGEVDTGPRGYCRPASDATPAVLAICGGGNGAHALAAVASAHFNGDIVWLTSSEEKADRLRQGGFSAQGLRATGAVEATARRVTIVSADPAAVIPQSDLVVLVVPAFAHLLLLSRGAPSLKTRAWIIAMPSRSGCAFDLRAV